MNLIIPLISGSLLLWTIWFISLAVFGAATVWIGKRLRLRRPSQLGPDECGAAYSLSFVLTIPLYLVFCGLMLETTFLIIARIGTVYAAYAGARSAAAWDALQDPVLASERLHEAICSGLAPFAVSAGFDPTASNSASDGLAPHMLSAADDYAAAMQKSAGTERDLDSAELVRHYYRICHRVTAHKQHHSQDADHAVSVSVTYRAPLIFPGVARLFDEDHRRPFEYPLTATVHMSRSVATAPRGTLGIDYHAY